jgi:hypothetical protein
MTAVLIPHPAAGLQRAREVVLHPDFHSAGAVLDACEHLEAWGSGADVVDARALRRTIVGNAVTEINRQGRRQRLIRGIGLVLVTIAMIAALVAQVL